MFPHSVILIMWIVWKLPRGHQFNTSARTKFFDKKCKDTISNGISDTITIYEQLTFISLFSGKMKLKSSFSTCRLLIELLTNFSVEIRDRIEYVFIRNNSYR